MTATARLVKILKDEQQDFEWYPTTNEIINAIKNDFGYNSNFPTILDCGAGDGRVLSALTEGKKYAIEKAQPLVERMPSDIFIVGSDFYKQVLIDKKVDVVFSNPPYSEYESWSKKIITEANANAIYLVIPDRWRQSLDIKLAFDQRGIKIEDAKILGRFDFLNADRQARAKIEIVKIDMSHKGKGPFSVWFDSQFPNFAKFDFKVDKGERENNLNNELVNGSDLIMALEKIYLQELNGLISLYELISEINPKVFTSLDIKKDHIKERLRLQIQSLKTSYWEELFSRLEKITSRLTVSKRRNMLSVLAENTSIDFTAANAYMIVIWVIKNANTHFDSQLIDLVEAMTEKANIKLYKSNQRTYGDECWRYRSTPSELSNYALEYRLVLSRVGGIAYSSYDRRSRGGLTENAYNFLSDILTVANNLGFEQDKEKAWNPAIERMVWEGGKKQTLYAFDVRKGEEIILFEARAFQNQNIHIKFNQSFICRLNVEFGRLKGWIKSPKQAAEEMDAPEDIAASFGSNYRLTHENAVKLIA